MLQVRVCGVSLFFLNYYLRVCNVELGKDRLIKIIALSEHLARLLFTLPTTFSLTLGLCVPQGCLYSFFLVLLTLLLDFLASTTSCKEKTSLRVHVAS